MSTLLDLTVSTPQSDFSSISHIRVKKSWLTSAHEKSTLVSEPNKSKKKSKPEKPKEDKAPIKEDKNKKEKSKKKVEEDPVAAAARKSARSGNKTAETWEHLIVIQLGSSHLTIGRALERKPVMIPMAIAYRNVHATFPFKKEKSVFV